MLAAHDCRNVGTMRLELATLQQARWSAAAHIPPIHADQGTLRSFAGYMHAMTEVSGRCHLHALVLSITLGRLLYESVAATAPRCT